VLDGGNRIRIVRVAKAIVPPAMRNAGARRDRQGAQIIPMAISKKLNRKTIPTGEIGVLGTSNNRTRSGKLINRPQRKMK
jgi:hypothetical protein